MNYEQICGMIILPIAVTGTFFNWAVVCFGGKVASFTESFGRLSVSQALADAIHSSLILVFYCPMVFWDIQIFKEYSHHPGFVLVCCYELSVQMHFAISLNRLVATYFHSSYHIIFSNRNIKIVIALIWFITILTTFLYYEVLCPFSYRDMTGLFYFNDMENCYNLSWYTDFCKYLVMVILIVIMDCATVVKIHKMHRKVDYRRSRNLYYTSKEIHFLKQTVFQGFIFVIELFNYFILPKYLNDQWALFFSTTFTWVTVHAADGFLTVNINTDLRRFIWSKIYIEKINVPSIEIFTTDH